MSMRTCPNCGCEVPVDDAWAGSVLSLLMPAPAIPDMATQVRCLNCGQLFAQGDLRYQDAGSAGAWRGVALFGCALLVSWMLYRRR